MSAKEYYSQNKDRVLRETKGDATKALHLLMEGYAINHRFFLSTDESPKGATQKAGEIEIDGVLYSIFEKLNNRVA